jgi:hypothetical protein
MNELGNLLDKVVRASRTKEIKEALYAYRTMVELDMTLSEKYRKRLGTVYNWDDIFLKGTRRSYEEDTYPQVYEMIENQRERVIELMGLSDVTKKSDLSVVFYRYGKRDFSDEEFIQLLTNVVWDYFYSKRKSPINIQKVEKDQNSFLVSFNEPMEIPTE